MPSTLCGTAPGTPSAQDSAELLCKAEISEIRSGWAHRINASFGINYPVKLRPPATDGVARMRGKGPELFGNHSLMQLRSTPNLLRDGGGLADLSLG